MTPKKAFILAGGKGTRLRPVTYEIPKPLITVQKRPILSYLVDLFKEHGVEDVFVSIQNDHREDFNRWKREFHSDENIEFIVEHEPLGTFGGLMLAREHLKDAPFFMSNGDELKRYNLSRLAELHHKNGATATLALVEVEDPHRYGVPVRSGDVIHDFLEKPEDPPSNFISSGLYIMDPKVFEHFPHKEPGFAMVEKALFPSLAERGELFGCELEGDWYDCGTLERWEKAIHEWRQDHMDE